MTTLILKNTASGKGMLALYCENGFVTEEVGSDNGKAKYLRSLIDEGKKIPGQSGPGNT